MKLEQILTLWTYCYHVTSESNLESIQQSRVLSPAETLLKGAKMHHFLRLRRTGDLLLRIEANDVLVRNQCPLDPDSLDLGTTGTLEEYVECLNSHVYFWPGTASGPIEDGVRMFERTDRTSSVVMRVLTASLLDANSTLPIYVSTCNTGVAWKERGNRSRRGPEVFQTVEAFSAQPDNVHEICFANNVCLPQNTEYGTSPNGPWRALIHS